ncbi:MAG: cytochrome-c oxidase [SAR86 cluster bacterium]|uniref:Cytochrome-c oxidase n=1 Tax=SAR86 cluster bacterium TaxID=2030880 RepID=A0A2A5B872_9GAMM|nr:MAG: cytochrome-c oxidase [SAR86 cluster bacterium]
MSLFKALTVKPWEHKGVIGDLDAEAVFDTASEKVALVVFLVIASVIFSMFTVSYFIRMELPDWTPLSEPSQLWINTGLLVISSVLFQVARNIVSTGNRKNITAAFIGGGIFAILFIAGQMLTWQSLQASGYYVASNPANSFFYLLTGLHALHLLGGLWVWSKSSIRLLSGGKPEDLRLSIELCTLYWHFLLIVWLLMFAVLSNT